RLKEDLLVDPLLPSDLLDNADQLSVHETRNLPGILRLSGPGDLRLQPRLRDVGASELHLLAPTVQHQPVRRNRREPAADLGAARHPAPDLPTDGPTILPFLPQLSIESGGGFVEAGATLVTA